MTLPETSPDFWLGSNTFRKREQESRRLLAHVLTVPGRELHSPAPGLRGSCVQINVAGGPGEISRGRTGFRAAAEGRGHAAASGKRIIPWRASSAHTATD